jgi:hypothetical protein
MCILNQLSDIAVGLTRMILMFMFNLFITNEYEDMFPEELCHFNIYINCMKYKVIVRHKNENAIFPVDIVDIDGSC